MEDVTNFDENDLILPQRPHGAKATVLHEIPPAQAGWVAAFHNGYTVVHPDG